MAHQLRGANKFIVTTVKIKIAKLTFLSEESEKAITKLETSAS